MNKEKEPSPEVIKKQIIEAILMSLKQSGIEDRNKEISYLGYVKEQAEKYGVIELSKFDPKRETLKTVLRKFKYEKLKL